MNVAQIREEYKNLITKDSEAKVILDLYKAFANLLALVAGKDLAFKKPILKITMNQLKALITLTFDVARGFKNEG